MIYCKQTTTSHHLANTYPECLEDINSLLLSEGYIGSTSLFLSSEIVLNMDRAEELYSLSIGRAEKNMSMDFALGLKAVHDPINRQILLVELKFNMTSFYNLKKQDLEDKVNGSINLLTGGVPVYKQYIFIFQRGYLAEAVSRIYRMNPMLDSRFVAYDIESLKGKFF